jgi:hypothetical protein
MQLTVIHAFGDYERGEKISDKAAVEKVLKENPRSVVCTQGDWQTAEDKPKPVEKPAT